MNDPWIKPFQEKLGDYELDVPVPSPARRRAAWPWLLSAAAAAVAVFLLLPSRKSEPADQAALRTPGEYPATLLAENIPHPDRQPLPPRRAVRPEFPVQNETAAEETRPLPEVVPDAVPESVQDIIPETAREAMPEREPKSGVLVCVPTRRIRELSVLVHAGYMRAARSAEGGSLLNPADMAKNPTELEETLAALFNPSNQNQNVETTPHYSTEQLEQDNWICLLPAKAGLSLRYQITPAFGVESGILYSYQYARELTWQGRKCHTHYLGIPLKASLRMAQWGRQQVYTTFGGEAEWLVGGHIDTPNATGVQQTTSARIEGHPAQYSLMGAAGIDFGLSRRLSLYVEPGLAWHFEPAGNLPNYYREHPLSFDLRAGLRFTL